MAQKDKELLLKDLSARLPYDVMCQTDEHGKIHKLKGINKHKGIWWYEFDGFRNIKPPKPYLRPMSSMTEEEFFEYRRIKFSKVTYREEYKRIDVGKYHNVGIIPIDEYLDWLNAHHFDFRNLIERGLAIEAPGDMYKID